MAAAASHKIHEFCDAVAKTMRYPQGDEKVYLRELRKINEVNKLLCSRENRDDDEGLIVFPPKADDKY